MTRATVEQFKQQCKAFDQAASTDAATDLGQTVEEELPLAYQIPYETMNAAEPSLLEKAHTRHYRGLWHELVQHLTDLGYLTEHQFITYHKLRKEIPDEPRLLLPVLQATVQYLGEENWPLLAQMFKGKLADIQLPHLEEHLGHIVERISRYTSFDGSLPPPEEYQVGAGNCYGRSLAFRVRTLFTLDAKLRDVFVFEPSHLKFLYSFQNLIGLKFLPPHPQPNEAVIPEECWQILCDVDRLFDRFKEARPEGIGVNKIVLSYPLNAKDEMEGDSEDDDEGEEEDEDKFLRGRERRRGRRMTKASKILADTGYHQMAIRILQVKLWQTHFYIGAVDGAWGEVSHRAVESLIEQEEAILPQKNNGKPKRKHRLAIAKAFFQTPADNDGQATVVIGFNAMYELLQNYHVAPRAMKQSSTAEDDEMATQLTQLHKEIATADDASGSRRERRRNRRRNNNEEEVIPDEEDFRQLDDQLLNSDDFNTLYPNLAETPQRRVAFARKSFLSGIKRGFVHIANWIKKGIKKLLGPVFGFFKLITGKIRAGIQQFLRGFRYLGHFLLGRPIVTFGKRAPGSDTVEVLATKFSLDFDGVNLISVTAGREDIQRHVNHIHDMKDSMFYFIDTTLSIIKMISKLAQPGGWVLLGWQIARMVAGELVDVVKMVA